MHNHINNIDLLLNLTIKLNHFFLNLEKFAMSKYEKEYKLWKSSNKRSLDLEEEKLVNLFYNPDNEQITLFKAKYMSKLWDTFLEKPYINYIQNYTAMSEEPENKMYPIIC